MGNLSFCRQAPGYNSCFEVEKRDQYGSEIEPCAIQIMFNVIVRGKPTSPFVGGSIGGWGSKFLLSVQIKLVFPFKLFDVSLSIFLNAITFIYACNFL